MAFSLVDMNRASQTETTQSSALGFVLGVPNSATLYPFFLGVLLAERTGRKWYPN
jgi:hypothetical protein